MWGHVLSLLRLRADSRHVWPQPIDLFDRFADVGRLPQLFGAGECVIEYGEEWRFYAALGQLRPEFGRSAKRVCQHGREVADAEEAEARERSVAAARGAARPVGISRSQLSEASCCETSPTKSRVASFGSLRRFSPGRDLICFSLARGRSLLPPPHGDRPRADGDALAARFHPSMGSRSAAAALQVDRQVCAPLEK